MGRKAKARRENNIKLVKRAKAELDAAISEVRSIRNALSGAYSFFNNTDDPGLTEAGIYEINALRARYDSALRSVKLRMTEAMK